MLRKLTVFFITFVLAAAAHGDASEYWFLGGRGSVGGVLSGSLTNDHAQALRYRIEVPDRYIIRDADFSMGRGVVIAVEPHGSVDRPQGTIYEIWLFRWKDDKQFEITFNDREVIYSSASTTAPSPAEPEFFINMSVYERPCDGITAFHFGDVMEGTVLLFDSCGDPIPFDTGRIAALLGGAPRNVTPLAWSKVGPKFSLVLQVTPAAGARQLMTFDPDNGGIELLPISALDGPTLHEIFWAASAERH